MTGGKDKIIAEAGKLWKKGSALDAGRLLYESMPIEKQPEWALRILDLSISHFDISIAPVKRFQHAAHNEESWSFARQSFSEMRHQVLFLERQPVKTISDHKELCILCIAECVAKVLYNTTAPQDPFDEDSGWWIARCLYQYLGYARDKSFSKLAWSTLCNI